MTNSLSVPRELLNISALHLEYSGYTETGKKLRALLEAPAAVCPKCFDLTGCPSCAPAAEVEGLEVSKLMLPALRQYMHNNGVGLLAAYDYELTEAIVSKLTSDKQAIIYQQAARIAELEREVCYLMGEITGEKHE